MPACVCGYLHSHIPHDCWRDNIKPFTRCEIKPRCKCGFLHPHIPHDCSTFPEKPKGKECPVCGPAKVTEAFNLTEEQSQKICSAACFEALGEDGADYPNYLEYVKRASSSPG